MGGGGGGGGLVENLIRYKQSTMGHLADRIWVRVCVCEG